MVPKKPRAVILLSGGLDSSTTLAVAHERGFDLYALSFRYGQTHEQELACARAQAARFSVVEHLIVDIDMRGVGGSRLVADGRRAPVVDSVIPATYVPARNTIFLSFALGWAEVLEAEAIFVGVNAVDYSGYPDCRPEYLQAFEQLARLATRVGVEHRTELRIEAPLLHLSKADIIRLALSLGVDLAWTHSCYFPTPEGLNCGTCESCQLRRKGFQDAGLADPRPYAAGRHSHD